MAKRKAPRTVATLTHDEASRKNLPTAEFRSMMDRSEQSPVRVAYERRNRALDPQLVWRGKDEQDWSDLVVQAPPLYIQEKVHPKVLIDDLRRRTENQRRDREDAGSESQPDLFADFHGLPDEGAKTEFYQHDANWIEGVDVFHPNTGEVRRDGADRIGCWFIDTDYSEESFFVRHASFLGANDPYKALKTTLKAEIDPTPGRPSTATSRAGSTAPSRAASPSRSSTTSATR